MHTLLTINQVAARVGLSRRTIEAYRQGALGDWFPEPVLIAERTPLYDQSTIDHWAANRRSPGRPHRTESP